MTILGKRVLVRPTGESDLSNIQRLWNNGDVMKWVGFNSGLNQTIEQISDWYQRMKSSPLTHHFVVLDKATNRFLGELFYAKDPRSGRAGLDIKLLPEAQGKGLATEALRIFIDYVFRTEGEVSAVWTEPSLENCAARSLYARCGLEERERPRDMESGDSYWELARKDWEKGFPTR